MHLVLTIPDVSHFGSATALAWTLLDAKSTVVRAASTTCAEVPRASTITALLPASRVVFIDTPLPRVGARKREQLVRFAIEDKLTIDPATLHAAIVGESRRGPTTIYTIAVTDSGWLKAALVWLNELAPTRLTLETDLVPVAAGEWAIALGEAYGYAKRDDGFVYTLDGGATHSPPFALVLALREARASGTAPEALTVFTRDTRTALTPALARAWSEALQCTVRVPSMSAARSLPPATAVNLLQGEFAPAHAGSAWLTRLRPAFLVMALIAASHIGFGLLEWGKLRREKEAINAEMTAVFKENFPAASAIVDPALQMERNVDALKRERGIGSTDPLRAALSDFAALRDTVPSLRVTRIDLSAEEALVEGSVADSAAQNDLSRAVGAIPQAVVKFSAEGNRFTLTARATR